MPERPTQKELNNKLKGAREAAENNDILLINPHALAADALELGYMIVNIAEILAAVLEETRPRDYAGQRPPTRSYEDQIRDKELFAFKNNSKYLGCKIYLKFTLNAQVVWLVSLHEDRRKPGR